MNTTPECGWLIWGSSMLSQTEALTNGSRTSCPSACEVQSQIPSFKGIWSSWEPERRFALVHLWLGRVTKGSSSQEFKLLNCWSLGERRWGRTSGCWLLPAQVSLLLLQCGPRAQWRVLSPGDLETLHFARGVTDWSHLSSKPVSSKPSTWQSRCSFTVDWRNE